MNEKIEHKGVVKQIRPGIVDVNITQMSACAACHAKGACTASDSAEKIIEVPYHQDNLKVGDVVTIVGSKKMGWNAVLLAFVLPFLLMMGTLVAGSELLKDELTAGILSLGILIPYYLILALFRVKLKKTFSFTLKVE